MGEKINACEILVGKIKGRDHMTWMGSLFYYIYVEEIRRGLNASVSEGIRRKAVMITAMNPPGSMKSGKFFDYLKNC
jgi:hypothetical protein